jgi:hypothetical protein
MASQLYPFTLTITGVTDSEVTWITPSNLGVIENGSTSILNVEAVNRGGATMKYRLASGEYNQLPQGLTLLPTGEIAGRTTFNTFAVDLGFTTFDATQSNITGISETNFDTEFTFTVNAYAEDTGQLLYNVASVNITSGGSGYSTINLPTLQFSSPVGATAVTAVGNAVVTGSAITAVTLTEQGAGYTSAPTITVTQGFGGSGAVLTPVMQVTGQRDAISVFKTFTVKVYRAYNYPYQNLFCLAMPPANDRLLINELLDDPEIFVPSYIYRPDDANFGKSTQVKYEHAYGLAPDTLDQYVSSLYENHYWKNLVLGEINTAQALDAAGNIIYEVVYSRIIDNLVNAAGQSVAKIVNLPYTIIDPADGSSQNHTSLSQQLDQHARSGDRCCGTNFNQITNLDDVKTNQWSCVGLYTKLGNLLYPARQVCTNCLLHTTIFCKAIEQCGFQSGQICAGPHFERKLGSSGPKMDSSRQPDHI